MGRVVCSWSGGIDSTALIGQLLRAGHSVLAVSLGIYGGKFAAREKAARDQLLPHLNTIGRIEQVEYSAHWLWAFSPDGVEIPRRNRLIIDHLVQSPACEAQSNDIGLGEYIGADSWVVQDHVGAADADARALQAYLYIEYGLPWRLWTLSDFGDARFKDQRLALGYKAGVPMQLTTNCLADADQHCGQCYKCIERSVAFHRLKAPDKTIYAVNPRESPAWSVYNAQMCGLPNTGLPVDSFPGIPMPKAARD